MLLFSAVKGSHILIDENGTARLTGLRESHCLSPNGYNHTFAYDFPLHAVASLPWLAPEVLEQVRFCSCLVPRCLLIEQFHYVNSLHEILHRYVSVQREMGCEEVTS